MQTTITEAEDLRVFDFESGTLADWQREGGSDSTSLRLVRVDEAAQWRYGSSIYNSIGWQGEWFLAAGDSRHTLHADAVLTSPPFELTRPFVTFLLAGELHPTVKVSLWVDGREVRRAYGNNAYDAVRRSWDVREWAGRTARIQVMDIHARRSLLRFDDVRLAHRPAPPLESFAIKRRTESNLLRLGEARLICDSHRFSPTGAVRSSALSRGPDGRWHLYGTLIDEQDEFKFGDTCRRLVHLSADSLRDVRWQDHGITLEASAAHGETHLAEPTVIWSGDRFHLFYLGRFNPFRGFRPPKPGEVPMYQGMTGPVGPQALFLATSEDGHNWTRHGRNPLFSDAAFLYQPTVIRVGNEWVMYYQATDDDTPAGRHGIACRRSPDLVTWGPRALCFMPHNTLAGYSKDPAACNPIVVRRDADWFLLTGPINSVGVPSRFHMSRIYRSTDPFYWAPDTSDEGWVYIDGGCRLVEEDGRWYMTTGNPLAGGVWLAEAHWNPRHLTGRD